ncbi:MAG: hypothetical protein OXG74_02665 [Acidobacteria bacterium]|nr:hypothetical protein [Acidobacteriota bacterium]
MITLADAVADLYRVVVIDGKPRSTLRLDLLADLCLQELALRGIGGAEKEVSVPGVGRDKKWDVAWNHGGKVRLGVSLKSLLKNIPGTVPNRADDLMGELANVQLHSPEIVTGYVMIFDLDASPARRDGQRWVDVFRSYISQIDGRTAPAWAAGMVEATAIVEVAFARGPNLVEPQNLDRFFDRLAEVVKERNPSLEDTT